MSAPRASETPSTAIPPATVRTVLLPGSPATYAHRAVLRGLGLRWDPEHHRWHGTTTAERVKELRERLGLEVRCFGDLEAPPKGPTASKPTIPRPAVAPTAVPARDSARRPHDGSRTRVEARVAFPSIEEADEITTPTRRFSELEITSGLPDDSREEDERTAERHLHELRGRVRAVRAVVSTTPGLAETLQCDSQKAARLFARFGVTEVQFWQGVPQSEQLEDAPPKNV